MALLHWQEQDRWGGAKIGDIRVVTKFLWRPKTLNGERRWLGYERIVQEQTRWRDYIPEVGDVTVRGWRDMAWVDGVAT